MVRVLVLALALMAARAGATCPPEFPTSAPPTWRETEAPIKSRFPKGGLQIERRVGGFYTTRVCFLGVEAEEGFAFDRSGRLSSILVRFKTGQLSLRGGAQGSPELDAVRLELEKLFGQARTERSEEGGRSWIWKTPQMEARLRWGPELLHADGHNLEAPPELRLRMEARPIPDKR